MDATLRPVGRGAGHVYATEIDDRGLVAVALGNTRGDRASHLAHAVDPMRRLPRR